MSVAWLAGQMRATAHLLAVVVNRGCSVLLTVLLVMPALASETAHADSILRSEFCSLPQAAAQSQASSAHAMRRFARRECRANPDVSVATSLHPPLTLPRQPPDVPPLLEPSERGQPRTKAEVVQQQQPRPQERQQWQQQTPASLEGQARQMAGRSAAGGTTATATGVKPEPASSGAQLQELPSGLQSMDLYADLGHGAQARMERETGAMQRAMAVSAPRAATAQAAAPLIDRRPQLGQSGLASQQLGSGQGGMALQQAGHGGERAQPGSDPGAPKQPQRQKPLPPLPQQQTPEVTVSSSLQALLSNPTALQALLSDPSQLQRLLEKHPALISVLKSTLGHK